MSNTMCKIMTLLMLFSLAVCLWPDSRYNSDKNLPFNEKAGNVNPQTGSVSLGYTDVSLPGRAGFDFTFGRVWSLDQANVFNMSYKNGSNRLNSHTVEQFSRLGTGWKSNLPLIIEDLNSDYVTLNLFFQGSVYEINRSTVSVNSAQKSNLRDYDLLNMRIFKDHGILYSQFPGLTALKSKYATISDLSGHSSEYQLLLKSNVKYYFRDDGRLMLQEDQSGLNRIWYFYETDVRGKRLKVAVDSLGREIVFNYDASGNLNQISWPVEVGVKNPDNTRVRQSLTRSISYTYQNGVTAFPVIQDYVNSVVDYQVPYLLTSMTDAMNQVTAYTYQAKEAGFTFNSQKMHSKNVYLLLTSAANHYTAVDGKYKNKRVFEYAVPKKGLYTRFFYQGYMEHYRISRQYQLNKQDELLNNTTYQYYKKNENNNINCYTAIIRQGGLKYTYTYTLSQNHSKDHVLDKLLLESDDGFIELKDYAYNSDRSKSLEEVYRQGKWVYTEKFWYDSKARLVRFEDRQGLITVTQFDDKYSLPIRIKQLVKVEGTKTEYLRENILTALGQVDKELIYLGQGAARRQVVQADYSYDVYGNVISVTDAEGNTVHSVYDGTYHTFPVKIYQDVEIASWSSGTVHDNWQTDATGTKTVRIRSWKVFNSDGTPWIEIDNEGYAVEHYYDAIRREIETVIPDEDDVRAFATPIVIVDGAPTGSDFDDFLSSTHYSGFLSSRQNNPGSRMQINDQADFVKTFTDIDLGSGAVKILGREGDGLGNVLREIEYKDSQEFSIKEMSYDAYGRMIALTDPDANRSSGQPVSINGKTVQKYDQTWLVKYDDLGRKVRVEYPLTRSTLDVKHIHYEDKANQVITIDPEGRETIEKYDWSGNLIKVERKGDSHTAAEDYQLFTYTYDELSRKTGFTDAKGIVTTYTYDERNLLVEQNYGDKQGSDLMDYNDLGQLVKKTDRKGQVIAFDYDQMGRNILSRHYKSEADYTNSNLSHSVALAYDNRGNAVRIANPHLIEHYIYDHANRVITLERKLKDSSLRQKLAAKVWPGDQANQVFSFNYTYNDAGMVTEMVYPDGQMHSFSYDSQLNRLQKIGQGPDSAGQVDFINSLSYNKAGVVTEMSYANGTSQSWQFDNRKRIKEINIKKGVDSITQMKYTLNGVGDIVGINLNEYEYDGFDRLISAQTQFPGTVDRFKLVIAHFGTYKNGSPLADGRVYNPDADLDKDGRINGEDHITASYDNERDVYDFEDFEYDRNGNRIKLVQNGDEYQYTYGSRNRLETIKLKKEGSKLLEDFAKYEYDANGNTIKRTIYGESGTSVIEFEYDTLNRLVKTKKNSSEITEYFYDNAGNRLIKKIAGQTTLYLRHGQIAVAMDLEVYESDPDNKGLINRYVLSGDLLAGRVTTTIKNDSSKVTENFYYHLDHLNSTKCVTKQDGTVEVLYEYRAFGEQLKRLDKDGNDTTDKAKYSYSQKQLDSETNLYYFNQRYYDPTIGRFINVDPLSDGTNWYVYCSNNPIAIKDPTGLLNVALHGGAAGAYNPKKTNSSGGANMEKYTDIVKKALGLTEDFKRPDFKYKGGKGWNTNYIEAVTYLGRRNWDKKGNNVLIGWSVGADAVANFLKDTDVKFNYIFIDGSQTKFLTSDAIKKISENNLTENGKLIIIDHENDYMDGNSFSKSLGGGDRLFDDWQGVIYDQNNSTMDRALKELESKEMMKDLDNVYHYTAPNSHSPHMNTIEKSIKESN